MPPGKPIPDHLRLIILYERHTNQKSWQEISTLTSLPSGSISSYYTHTMKKCHEAGIAHPTHTDLLKFWQSLKRGGTKSIIREDNFEKELLAIGKEQAERRRKRKERAELDPVELQRERDEKGMKDANERRERREAQDRTMGDMVRVARTEGLQRSGACFNSGIRPLPRYQSTQWPVYRYHSMGGPVFQQQQQHQQQQHYILTTNSPIPLTRGPPADTRYLPSPYRPIAMPIYRGPYVYYRLPAPNPQPIIYKIIDDNKQVHIKIEDEDENESHDELHVTRSTRVQNTIPVRDEKRIKVEVDDDYGHRFVEEMRSVAVDFLS